MTKITRLSDLGEVEIINLIGDLIYKKTKKSLIRDDTFFFDLFNKNITSESGQPTLVLNSDMLVSTTDVPPQMSFYQTGRKAVLMNISDLIVKGVQPQGIIISLGLLKDMDILNFNELMAGIIDFCFKWNLDYIGGDLNETKELTINPTVFGFQNRSNIIYRNGLKQGDYLLANGKFGLTGVGFDILLNRKGDLASYPHYKRSIFSVLEPKDIGREAFFLSLGFEIDFNDELFDKEALLYSQEFDVSLENLVFNGGEEFIHLFTINPKYYDSTLKVIQAKGGQIYKIGKVISSKKIYFLRDGKKIDLKKSGFEHFS